MKELRKLGKALREISECPHCGGSRFIAATSHKGHGTGVRGSVNYRAMGFEATNPETHCTCPGGVCWESLLLSDLGVLLKLEEGQVRYPALFNNEHKVAFYDADSGNWLAVSAKKWRDLVIFATKPDGGSE